MSDFLFATFLYAAMICFVCYLRYQPSCAANLPTEEPQPDDIHQVSTTFPEQKAEAAIPKAVLFENPFGEHEATNALIETETNSQLPVTSCIKNASEIGDNQSTSVSTGHSSLNTVFDPSKLTLRQCRAVIREINKGLPKPDRIRQKINGKDAPADWLRSQIARYLETYPANDMILEVVLKAC